MPNPRNNPADSDRGPDASAELAREHLRVLRKRRDYVVGEAYERRERGLRADLEFGEAAAIEWALAIVERSLFGLATGR